MEKPHKKLDVWKLAMELVDDIYALTRSFPREELYGLTDQIKRAAISVPANLAEGAARNTQKEFRNFVHIAQGSLSELDTELDIASRLQYLSREEREKLDAKMIRIDKMLTGLLKMDRR